MPEWIVQDSNNINVTQSDNNSQNLVLDATIKTAISDLVKEEIKREILTDKSSLFTVFWIFASLVTFVSVEIQILKTVCDIWNVFWFSLFLLSSLLSFVLVLDYIWRWWRNDFNQEFKKFPWILIFFISVLFFLSFFSMFFWKEQYCKENSIYSKYEIEFDYKQSELEKDLNFKQSKFEKKFQMELNSIKDNIKVLENK